MLSFPLIALAVIAYNVIGFFSSAPWSSEIFSLTMVSGTVWRFELGDLMIVIALILLFFEILKATRTGASSLLDHALSMVLFIICLMEFLLVPIAATSTYFVIMVIVLIDVVAGYSVTITSARRDFNVDRHPGGPF